MQGLGISDLEVYGAGRAYVYVCVVCLDRVAGRCICDERDLTETATKDPSKRTSTGEQSTQRARATARA